MREFMLLGVLAFGASAAQAENGFFYLGGGVTNGSVTANNNGYIAGGTRDLKKTSWKAFAGVRPLNWLALEADYIDLGSGSISSSGTTYTDTTRANSTAWAAYAIGFLPIPLPILDFYGKVGVARWKLNSTLIDYSFVDKSQTILPRSYSGTDFAWGFGVQAHVKRCGVRLEYEGFDVDRKLATITSLSVFLNL